MLWEREEGRGIGGKGVNCSLRMLSRQAHCLQAAARLLKIRESLGLNTATPGVQHVEAG